MYNNACITFEHISFGYRKHNEKEKREKEKKIELRMK
jgi:hypothetical protein